MKLNQYESFHFKSKSNEILFAQNTAKIKCELSYNTI